MKMAIQKPRREVSEESKLGHFELGLPGCKICEKAKFDSMVFVTAA